MPRTTLLQPSRYQRTRWKNDGGWTTELARRDDDAGGFLWRVSIAEIEREGPFSAFPGIERDLLLLEGNGIELDIGDQPARRLARRFERVHFAGEADVHCRQLAGPTRDFNVMARRDSVVADVTARPLVGSMLLFPETGAEWLIHVHAGGLVLHHDGAAIEAASGDSIRVEDGGSRITLEGSGEVVLVKFSPRALPDRG
jgi:environmental stress-induced protein Ves